MASESPAVLNISLSLSWSTVIVVVNLLDDGIVLVSVIVLALLAGDVDETGRGEVDGGSR